MIMKDYCKFERIVAEIFDNAGYATSLNVPLDVDGKKGDIDIIAIGNGMELCIEVKFSRVIEKAIARICDFAKSKNMIPVLVSAYEIEKSKRKQYTSTYSNLILIDIANLLFAVQDQTELRNELIAGLPYVVDQIEPREGFLKGNTLQYSDYTSTLIQEMEQCKSGRLQARSYEQLCYKLLENIFSDDLALWKEQSNSNDNLFRFDLLCRIKDQNKKTFWTILEQYFKSKYIVFEFKNYNDRISQKEIYTTEKYLYLKALRSVAVIISANGYDKNAYWAAKGCLRENGKLIILLDTNDLIEMNRLKVNHEDPSDFLLNKLDELLLELEK